MFWLSFGSLYTLSTPLFARVFNTISFVLQREPARAATGWRLWRQVLCRQPRGSGNGCGSLRHWQVWSAQKPFVNSWIKNKNYIPSIAQGHFRMNYSHSFSSSGPMQVTKTQVKRWLTVLYTQHNQQLQTQLRQFLKRSVISTSRYSHFTYIFITADQSEWVSNLVFYNWPDWGLKKV